MNQENQYGQNPQHQQYSYDHYDQAPRSQAPKGITEKIFGERISQKLKSPVVATGVLLLVGVAFAGVIVGSYPASDTEDIAIPTVQADARPFRTQPTEPGGMDVPFRESTVFNTMRTKDPLDPNTPIENLLEPDERALDKLAAFEGEAVEAMNITAGIDKSKSANSAKNDTGPESGERMASVDRTIEINKKPSEKPGKKARTIKQEVVKISPLELASSNAATTKTKTLRPEKLHAPAASPETLAFVRSVLDKKDKRATSGATTITAANTVKAAPPIPPPTEPVAAVEVARIEPAAGAATGAMASVGNHFIQLASVTSEQGATSEWKKLQKKFAVELDGLDYRVQRADLGERGIYYRIQAGPISKEEARSLCASIKAQKPGGCLVVK